MVVVGQRLAERRVGRVLTVDVVACSSVLFAPRQLHIVVCTLGSIEVVDGLANGLHLKVEDGGLAAADSDAFRDGQVARDGGGDGVIAFRDADEGESAVFGSGLKIGLQFVDVDDGATVVVVANEVDSAAERAHVVGEVLYGEDAAVAAHLTAVDGLASHDAIDPSAEMSMCSMESGVVSSAMGTLLCLRKRRGSRGWSGPTVPK